MNNDSKNDSRLDDTIDVLTLIKLQADRVARLVKVADWNKTNLNKRTLQFFELKLQFLKEIRHEFNSTHKTIVCNLDDGTDDYFTHDIASGFEDKFEEIYGDILAAKIQKFGENNNVIQSKVPESQSTYRPSSVQLPTLPIPKFSGNPIDWLANQDSFERMVRQDKNYNIMEKFQFLRMALPDTESDILQMPLCDSNYHTAWDLLVARYHIPRVIFMHQMNTLFALKPLTKESAPDIKQMLTTVSVCISTLKRLDIPINDCDHWITHLVANRLPAVTHQAWEYHWGSKTEIPQFKDLQYFLNHRLVTMTAIDNRHISHNIQSTLKPQIEQHKQQSKPDSHRMRQKTFHLTTTQSNSNSSMSCQLCNGPHMIRRCAKFIANDCYARKAIVDQHKLCLNCLSNQHLVAQCLSQKNCIQCGQRHHTMLHFPINVNTTSNASKSAFANSTTSAQVNSNTMHSHSTNLSSTVTSSSPNKVLLATALIPVRNINTGKTVVLRALIDDCSEGTLISNHAANTLGLTRTSKLTDITGVVELTQTIDSSIVSFEMRSNVNSNFSTTVDLAVVMDVVTSKLPSQSIIPQDWPHLKDLVLADPTYYKTNPIDLLIGSEMSASILLPDTRIGQSDHPVARNTHFGWILQGRAGAVNSIKTHSISVRVHHAAINLESLVRNFFDTEQVPEERTLTNDEQYFTDFFNKNTIRQSNGKYLVRLPLVTTVDPDKCIGRSKQIALNRFHQLERRLSKNPELKAKYAAGINEYFELNQIVPAISTENQHCIVTEFNKPAVTCCVLPHHAVIKEDSLTTQLRIVMDAACKTSNVKSLNDILFVGPALQTELPVIIMNWRLYRYVFTADIKKMYRCIDMHPDDSKYQRILWRDSSGNIQEYCLTTVTFGTASAPCTAISIMHRIADDEKDNFPLAEDVLKKETYVDDVESGSDTIESAIEKRDHIIGALASAGMELRKWSSNAPEVLDSIPSEHQSSATSLDFNSTETIKTLGMCWQPNGDQFKFKIKFDLPTTFTKRSVLSTIARLFDPVGFLTPVIVAAKIILKAIWNYKPTSALNSSLNWDDIIPESMHAQWQQFVKELPNVDRISIPRWLNYSSNEIKSLELHTFCDGAFPAYAANVYIRIEYPDRVYCHLLTAKSKVTPSKPLSIPRIELCGAELSTRLASWVTKNLRVSMDNVPLYFWSDAMVVLHWIKGDVNRWKTFVANRVSKILKISTPMQWNHVRTHENPADCATRGLTPSQLIASELWWNGPPWLTHTHESWLTHT